MSKKIVIVSGGELEESFVLRFHQCSSILYFLCLSLAKGEIFRFRIDLFGFPKIIHIKNNMESYIYVILLNGIYVF